MRVSLWLVTGAAVLTLFAGMAVAAGQRPDNSKGSKENGSKGPPDEEKEILKEIREAYKAPFEVHEDVLKELRKSYQSPSPEREAKLFRELRRLYQLTAEQEAAILREIRLAYEKPTAEQEDRLFRVIKQADRLPNGAVPVSVQADQTRKLFQKLDLNGDGLLSFDEMPDDLRNDRGRWDANRDGFIDQAEYAAYYQTRLRHLSEQVATGQIDLKLKKGGPTGVVAPPGGDAPVPSGSTTPADDPRPAVFRAGKLPSGLPDWYLKLDTDGDGQVGLYEWKTSGRPLAEFLAIDRNGDGLITPDDMLRYLADQPQDRSAGVTAAPGKR